MLQLIAMTFALCAWAETPNPGPRSTEQAQFLYQEALDAKKNGKDDLAVEDFKKILKQYPSFKETMMVYELLMGMQLNRKNLSETIELGNKAILLNPKGRAFGAIQLLRAEAELKNGKPAASLVVLNELIKAKPETDALSKAMILKAESLSQLGKHKEAIASLDSARGHEQFADTELKLRARSCSAMKPDGKGDEYSYFNRKNLCFKESAALAKASPASDSSKVWCDQFAQLNKELNQSKIDQYSKEKIEKDLKMTKALSATWGCQ
jgi:tetratricopeptide (TPR) repeat protein